MFFVKKSKHNIDFIVIDKIVHAYFDYLDDIQLPFTCSDISEMFRYSICRLLDLDTVEYSKRLQELSKGVVNTLEPFVRKNKLKEQSLSFRQGFLEACVHCMEMSRKKVEENR